MSETLTLAAGDRSTGWERRTNAFIKQALQQGARVTLKVEFPTLSPQEFADQFGLSRSTVTRRILAGEIKATRKGNRYRIPESQVEEFRQKYVRELATSFADDF